MSWTERVPEELKSPSGRPAKYAARKSKTSCTVTAPESLISAAQWQRVGVQETPGPANAPKAAAQFVASRTAQLGPAVQHAPGSAI